MIKSEADSRAGREEQQESHRARAAERREGPGARQGREAGAPKRGDGALRTGPRAAASERSSSSLRGQIFSFGSSKMRIQMCS